ncbi:MBL fold metallo-hydrolase [Burkholderiaceae bacterium FT117]|uniref:MBL fold metallo-hydrolase n=1 Tax=Zeimonas sediminis TaxID=2944268 RepID=UPI002342D790|nr:MBL fold metallo-hydrolase [Zeimonas sediminis]MCM5571486.1 MBL fold metallo-hydrolase [Zeimonas sediminis]
MIAGLPDTVRFVERDWLSSNQVFLVDGGEATVVDTGYVKHAPMTAAIVGRLLEQTGSRLATIVNTHLHSDHCGGNRLLAETFGARILVPEASVEDVAQWDEQALTFAATGQRCDRFQAQGGISPGDELVMGGLRWRAHAAPGHDPKSLVFHCPEARLLISADALWENGFGVIFPELEGESGFDEQQAILELIATLDVDLVLPGHGPAFGDVGAALRTAFSRLEALREDPTRQPRHGLKVLIKYLMLDLERIETERFVERFRVASIPRHAAHRLGLSPDRAIRDTISQLVAQGQLAEDAGWLIDASAA